MDEAKCSFCSGPNEFDDRSVVPSGTNSRRFEEARTDLRRVEVVHRGDAARDVAEVGRRGWSAGVVFGRVWTREGHDGNAVECRQGHDPVVAACAGDGAGGRRRKADRVCRPPVLLREYVLELCMRDEVAAPERATVGCGGPTVLEEGRQAGHYKQLIIVAAPAMLGDLRPRLSDATEKLVTAEFSKDLTGHDPADIIALIDA